MADATEIMKQRVLRWGLIAAAIGAIAIPTVIVIVAFGYASYFHRYSRLTLQISEQSGLNLYLVKAAAALLAIPLVYGIKFLHSLNRKRRQIGVALIAFSTVLYNTGLYWLTRDANFSLQGKTLKWYAITPVGVKYYDRPGVDTKYGILTKPVTPDVVRYLEKLGGSPLALQDPSKAEWFNPITDDPELWYAELPNDTFKFFNKPGFDPTTGATLQPVSKEFHDRWQAQRTAAQADEQKRREAAGRAAATKEEADRAAGELLRQQEAVQLAAAENAKRQAAENLQSALPSWRAADDRLKAELIFWNHMRQELSGGNSLRPEIESALQLAQSTASDCEHNYSQGDGDALRMCARSLNIIVDRLAAFRN